MKIIRVESVQKIDMKPQNYDIFTVMCSFDKTLPFLFFLWISVLIKFGLKFEYVKIDDTRYFCIKST